VGNIANVFIYRSLRELPSADTPVKRVVSAPAGPLATPATMVKSILDRNLMAARREDMNPKPVEAPKPEESNKVVPCTIAANIVGVIAGNRPEWSYVVYRDTKAGDTGVFTPRDGRNKLPGDITLLEVRPGEARFRKDGHIEQCIIWSDIQKPETTLATVAPEQ